MTEKKIQNNNFKTTSKADTKEEASDKKSLNKESREKKADPIKELNEKVKALKQEAEESYNRFLRVSAEFENYKKRTAREMDEFRKFANETFAKEVLSIMDNLERAVDTSCDENNAKSGIVEGVKITLKELQKIFEKFMIKKIESLDKPFDPNFHQAVMQEETEDKEDNTVIRELQPGYMIHNRLLRPAMVIVSKMRAAQDTDKEDKVATDTDRNQ